jgi:hypothetical protein
MNKLDSSESLIGILVKIKTFLNEEIKVLIDSLTQLTQKKSYRIIKTSFIKEIEYLGKNENIELQLPSINISKIRKKEEQKILQAQEEANKIGIGVTKEAQEIFNALSKTLPCNWQKDIIVVLNEVYIKSPYNIEDCYGNDINTLERVKKVLEGERKKILNKQNL